MLDNIIAFIDKDWNVLLWFERELGMTLIL